MAKMDTSILEAALVGYRSEHDRISHAMAEIRKELGQRIPRASANRAIDEEKAKRRLSGAARKRIAAAQKKRWAAFHKEKAEAAKPKRKLSAAAKAKLVANLAKARAAKAAKRAA